MKRTLLIIAAFAAALTLGSCQKNQKSYEENAINLEDYEAITADFPEELAYNNSDVANAATKSGYYSTGWQKGDSITVYLEMILGGTFNGGHVFEYDGRQWKLTVDPRMIAAFNANQTNSGKLTMAQVVQKFMTLYPQGNAAAIYVVKMNGNHLTAHSAGVSTTPDAYVSSAQLTYKAERVDGNVLHFSFRMKDSYDIHTPFALEVPKSYYESNTSKFSSLQQIKAVILCFGSKLDDPGVEKNTVYCQYKNFDPATVSAPVDDYYRFFFPATQDPANFSFIKGNKDVVKDSIFFGYLGSPKFVTRYRLK